MRAAAASSASSTTERRRCRTPSPRAGRSAPLRTEWFDTAGWTPFKTRPLAGRFLAYSRCRSLAVEPSSARRVPYVGPLCQPRIPHHAPSDGCPGDPALDATGRHAPANIGDLRRASHFEHVDETRRHRGIDVALLRVRRRPARHRPVGRMSPDWARRVRCRQRALPQGPDATRRAGVVTRAQHATRPLWFSKPLGGPVRFLRS